MLRFARFQFRIPHGIATLGKLRDQPVIATETVILQISGVFSQYLSNDSPPKTLGCRESHHSAFGGVTPCFSSLAK